MKVDEIANEIVLLVPDKDKTKAWKLLNQFLDTVYDRALKITGRR